MKTTVNEYAFRELFRAIRPDNFSRAGLSVLWDYLTELEADTGEEIELDVVALCCDFSEATASEIASDYCIDLSECSDESDIFDTVLDYLENKYMLVGHAGHCTPIVYRNL